MERIIDEYGMSFFYVIIGVAIIGALVGIFVIYG